MNSDALKKYIEKHHALFWYVRKDAKADLSLEAVVETMLIFGRVAYIKELFDLVGINEVSDIFKRQVSRKRVNYPERTVHYFRMYFDKHVR
ncbi:MAG: hypothetical protein ABIL68_04795 [bacterium]